MTTQNIDDEENGPCPHGEEPISKCQTCRDQPRKNKKIVYFTDGGICYHWDSKCEALEWGQGKVDKRGGTRAPIETAYERDIKFERNPCQVCVTVKD